ncbi:MAG: 16S rRNA (cytosine(1402)-N(4))-methyltransferase RsmH [Patescibacteria group bacterium]|nr:16S rRNA (cytosine(1402)-N(4))-methyltransferase RsmH [Patescibacteria group bacterium]
MHIPVLRKQVLEYLAVKANENFVDATIGEAGHSLAILEKNKPNGKVLGMDIDIKMIERIAQNKRLILEQSSYANIKNICEKHNFKPDGILFDLGMSSWHIDASKKGFSFQKDEPLIMRYDENSGLSAKEIVNNYSEKDIEIILSEFGGERFARKIANAIVRARKITPIETTFQLKNIVCQAIPQRFRHKGIHCATKSFQAIRIVVNKELDILNQGLCQAIETLNLQGRIAVISFHSGEDRIVKKFFKEKEKQGIVKILTKKPIKADYKEIKENPRSRSALLRAMIKIKKTSQEN